MDLSKPVDRAFTKRLPKVELHAHLNGSITRECLHEIWLRKKKAAVESSDFNVEDPWILMPPGKVDYGLNIFFDVFSKSIYNLCNDLVSIAHATHSVLQEFHADGVRYLELRTTPRETRDGAGRVTISKDDYIITVLDTITKFKRQQEERLAEDKERMAVYLILSVDRAKDTLAQAMEVVDLALKHCDRGIIVGIDLCGNPTKGNVSIYKDAYAKAKCRGLKVTLHFAETAFSGGLQELETLLSFQPDRIGHVIHVPNTIKEKITERNIGLELCMSCNVHAKMVHGSFEDHHFGYWWKTNCPIALCTDDVGFFCSPVSNEYLLAAEHFKLGRADLVELCRRGIDSIFGGDLEKDRLRRLLRGFTSEQDNS